MLLVQLGELVDPGGRQERLEAEDARVVQGPQVLDVVGQGAAPEADVDVRLGAGDVLLGAQVVDHRGRREGVEGHVDQGRDATGRRGARGGPEALPLRAAGVVDVHVGVDEAWQQDVVAEVLHSGSGRHLGVVREHGRDLSPGDGDRGGPRPFGGDHARRAQDQFAPSVVGHPDPSPCRTSLHAAHVSVPPVAFRCLLPRNGIQRSVEGVFTPRSTPSRVGFPADRCRRIPWTFPQSGITLPPRRT